MLREDWKRMAIILTTEDDEGLEIETVIGAHSEVCPTCDGKGKMDNPAFSNGLTSEDLRDWDDEELDAYAEGRYDVTCDECEGRRVILASNGDDPNIEQLHKWQQEEYNYRQMCEAERRMGC